MPLPHSLRAFRHRDYRLYFAGQGISQTGTWLQLIASSWLIYHLSGSAFLLGLATFTLHIPLLVLGPFAGVWVDRQRKRKVLLITQSVALVQSLAMLSAASINTVLQTIVEDHMRARVVSIYMMSFLGVTPLGALFAGMLAERMGPPATLAIGGVLALCAAFLYWMNLSKIRTAIRPTYEKLGIVKP